MSPEKFLDDFAKAFPRKILNSRVEKTSHKLKSTEEKKRVWIEIGKDSLKDAVGTLCRLWPLPHFAVVSGYDLGAFVELNYIFSVDYGKRMSETIVVFKAKLPKEDLTVETITGFIPGALVSEREIQEMLGVKVKGIPDPRRLFLDESFPKNRFPWRRDEKGVEKMVRNLNESGKE